MNEYKVRQDRILEAASNCEDATATLKVLFPEAFKNQRTCKYGDVIRIGRLGGGKYIIAQTGYGACQLISLEFDKGNRNSDDPTKIKDVSAITEEEMSELTGGSNWTIEKEK